MNAINIDLSDLGMSRWSDKSFRNHELCKFFYLIGMMVVYHLFLYEISLNCQITMILLRSNGWPRCLLWCSVWTILVQLIYFINVWVYVLVDGFHIWRQYKTSQELENMFYANTILSVLGKILDDKTVDTRCIGTFLHDKDPLQKYVDTQELKTLEDVFIPELNARIYHLTNQHQRNTQDLSHKTTQRRLQTMLLWERSESMDWCGSLHPTMERYENLCGDSRYRRMSGLYHKNCVSVAEYGMIKYFRRGKLIVCYSKQWCLYNILCP